jgi:hypothetical protein
MNAVRCGLFAVCAGLAVLLAASPAEASAHVSFVRASITSASLDNPLPLVTASPAVGVDVDRSADDDGDDDDDGGEAIRARARWSLSSPSCSVSVLLTLLALPEHLTDECCLRGPPVSAPSI